MAPRKGGKKAKKTVDASAPARHNRELITEELIHRIELAVMVGSTYEIAARSVGIAESTFRNWRRRGEEEMLAGIVPADSLYVKLLAVLDRAEAEGEIRMLGSIAGQGAEGMKWILARRHPARWQETQKLKLEMERRADELMDQLREGLSDAEFSKVLAVLAAGGDTGE